MLALSFAAGRDRLALDIRRVAEVVPRVRLTPLEGAPPWLAGTFVYRGEVVPVIDLHRLAGAGDCPELLSSRIILIPAGGRLLGLLAAQVADLCEVEAPADPVSLAAPGRPDLGPAVADGKGVLRLLDPDRLLPEDARRLLALEAPP
jgi:chemotaxis-related protein WspB